MAVKAVLFDLYGVLGINGWQKFKTQHFGDRPEDWERLRMLGHKVDAGEAKQSELVAAVADTTGVSIDTVRYQLDHTTPNEALVDYIKRLKPAYKIGLLSNASRDVFSSIFTDAQLELFDAIVSSYHVGLVKPDPRMFQEICDQLGVLPEECVMIDDTPRHLAAAAQLGMKTVLYDGVEGLDAVLQGVLRT